MRSKKRSLRCQGRDSQLTVLPTFLICWMISLLEVSMEGLAAFMALNQPARGQTRNGEITLNKSSFYRCKQSQENKQTQGKEA